MPTNNKTMSAERAEKQDDAPNTNTTKPALPNSMTSEASTTVGTSEREQIIGGVFVLGKKLGSGSFGDIYWCYHNVTHEEYAVKIEPSDCKHPQLMYEAKLLRHLQGGPGISQVVILVGG